MKKDDEVFVTRHAAIQARRRFRVLDADMLDITKMIENEVRAGWNSGRVLNHKPKWALLYGQRVKQFSHGEHFVYTKDEKRGWLVRKDHDTRYVVVTSLFRVVSDTDTTSNAEASGL